MSEFSIFLQRSVSSGLFDLKPDLHQSLFHSWWGEYLATRLLSFAQHGVPNTPPAPRFSVECSMPLTEAYAPLVGVMQRWLTSPEDEDLLAAMHAALVDTGLEGLLILLGQRWTPASLKDHRAIPPTPAHLLESANKAHSDKDALSVAARALAKHAARHPDPWWGKATGNTAQKNANAEDVLRRILAEPTWWNVFGHYAHDTVFEVRCPSGHGARWGHGGDVLIGFLEPFDETKGGVGQKS